MTPYWRLLQLEPLFGAPGVRHFVTTRQDGASAPPFDGLNLSRRVGDDPSAVDENWRRLCGATGLDPERIALAEQVHGATVLTIADAGEAATEPADGMVTTTPGLCLAVLVADCAPVLAADPVHGVVGIAHAGWRGTVAGVTPALIRAMAAAGAEPSSIRYAVGPCIGYAEYEVGEEVARAVQRAFDSDECDRILRPKSGDRWWFDIARANLIQAERCGVPPDQASTSAWTTRESPDLFFSHRRSGGLTGRFAAGVWLA